MFFEMYYIKFLVYTCSRSVLDNLLDKDFGYYLELAFKYFKLSISEHLKIMHFIMKIFFSIIQNTLHD